MAMIDYGAILRVDGKIINHDMFMDVSDTGCKPADKVEINGETMNFNGDFFVYAGDEKFMVATYKTYLCVVSDGRVIWDKWPWYCNVVGETRFFDGFPSVTVRHLDPVMYPVYPGPFDPWPDDLCTKKEADRMRFRYAKKARKPLYKSFTNRFIATWDYDGRHYEIIYGYGIDPDKEIWDYIKNINYGFTQTEIEVIDSWFAET